MPLLLIICVLMLFISRIPSAKLDYKAKFALAQAHYERVRWNTQCSIPQPRVFRMGTPELKVVPPATILHRCGDSTGCCDSLLEKCVSKTKEKVKLYFFVKSVDGRPWRRNRRLKVQKFILTNHTACHCIDQRKIPR